MSLRRRLVLLHAAFAAFAVTAAVATIYAVRFQVYQAASRFERHVGEVEHLDDCRSDLRTLDVHLHELVTGVRPADDEFDAFAQSVLMRLREIDRYSSARTTAQPRALSALIDDLEAKLQRVVELARGDQEAAARAVFKSEIETRLIKPLESNLGKMRESTEGSLRAGSLELLERDSQLLMIAALIGVAGVALVVTGMLVVRRRLVRPIQMLQSAAQTFAAGELDYRVQLPMRDELGDLGESMNGMAGALRRSQRKYQSLFENLRDAVVICDRNGRIQECHNGDAKLLMAESEGCAGRRASDIWPEWRFAGRSWTELIDNVIAGDQPLRFSDVSIVAADGRPMFADVVAYGVQYADEPYVAIVIRDVSERRRLQEAARRADTMEAAVNFARGIAHDFKNLLHSAHVSLVGIRETAEARDTVERATTAIEACRQAASLSKRLTRFSAADEGEPEPVGLAETVRLILDALDRDLFEGVEVSVITDSSGVVLIDRDQLTQIVLNLVYNAIDAMPKGGTLTISIDRKMFAHPLSSGPPAPHQVLTVGDTGCGIDRASLEHVFEPLYSTKPRTQAGPRGMGLAVVYAAVSHARGFVQLDSSPNEGTIVRIYLPELPQGERASKPPASSPRATGPRFDS